MLKKSRKVIIGIISIFVVFSLISFPLKTVSYNITDDKIKENIKIAQISDLHNCYYGKNMTNLIKAINKENPDIIVFTGDIFDENYDNKNTMTFLRNICKKYDCYMVAGNHEDILPNWINYKNEIVELGMNVLEGNNINIKGLTICGAAQAADKSFGFEEALNNCSKNINTDNYNILLAHYPAKIDKYKALNCFDLVLCGHAHGGQWRVPFLINGVFAPDEGLFPEYAGGKFDFNNCSLIVSRGLSRTKHIIPRFFNNPELVIINLSAS